MRHVRLLYEITEGNMRGGKPTRGRRRLEMLHDLANDGRVALKCADEDKE